MQENKELEEAYERLSKENSFHREKREKVEVLVRKEVPCYEGLSFEQIFKNIVRDKNKAESLKRKMENFLKDLKYTLKTERDAKAGAEMIEAFLLKELKQKL